MGTYGEGEGVSRVTKGRIRRSMEFISVQLFTSLKLHTRKDTVKIVPIMQLATVKEAG